MNPGVHQQGDLKRPLNKTKQWQLLHSCALLLPNWCATLTQCCLDRVIQKWVTLNDMELKVLISPNVPPCTLRRIRVAINTPAILESSSPSLRLSLTCAERVVSCGSFQFAEHSLMKVRGREPAWGASQISSICRFLAHCLNRKLFRCAIFKTLISARKSEDRAKPPS